MNSVFIDKWQSQVKKGTLAFIVLLVLKEKELYGYELIEQIKTLTTIDIAEGTLYPLMNRLHTNDLLKSRWIEQDSGIPRKYYKLTLTGRQTLKAMIKEWNDLQNSINRIL